MATVLLAEDDETMRAVMATALRAAGHDVVEAANGRSALNYATHWEFDLMVANLRAPCVDAVELARRARMVNDNLQVVFVDGFVTRTLIGFEGALWRTPILAEPVHLRRLPQVVSAMESPRPGDAIMS